jgi:predicted transcriptional regulator
MAIDRMPSTGQELFELVNMRLGELKHELEQSDNSIAKILASGVSKETEMRNYIADWMEKCAHGRYLTSQEEELADAKRPDIRIRGIGVEQTVPIELKLVDMKWSGNKFLERLENQLAGDYLRDNRSQYGVFLLVYKNQNSQPKKWVINSQHLSFTALVDALQQHWYAIQERYSNIQDIQVIGIDLSARYL